MKKMYCMLLSVLFLTACTTIKYQKKDDTLKAPIANEQGLRYSSAEFAGQEVLFFDKGSIEQLKEFVNGIAQPKTIYGNLHEMTIVENDTSKITSSAAMLKKVSAELNTISSGKIYLEIQSAGTAKGIVTTLVNNQINLSVEESSERVSVFRHIIETNLRLKGYTLASSEKEADYKVSVYVSQDGVNSKSSWTIFSSTKKREASVNLDVSIFEIKSNELIFAYKVSSKAYLSETRILFFIGPFYDSSFIM